MKVAIVNLTSGGLSGGYRKYLRALIPILRRDSRISHLDLFVPEGLQLEPSGPLRTWPADGGFAGHRALRRELQTLSPDVVFFPTARRIDCGAVPTVVMVRNMEPLTVPFGGNTWRESLRNIVRARAARAACRRASRVIAVSAHVQRFVTEHWELPPERVALVYHGIDDPDEAASVMPSSCVGLGPFVFTAGSIRPARGLEDLIGAAPALLRRNPALRIVIAGQADSSSRPYEIRMHRLAARLGVADAILWAGHLTQPEMAWAFKHCAVFVLTSRAEACPNVALEALSHGAPIVSTLQEPMPEFFLETAAYYRPQEPGDLAAQIERVMRIAAEGPVVSAQRREVALARASVFSWARTADETVKQLQLAAGTRVHA